MKKNKIILILLTLFVVIFSLGSESGKRSEIFKTDQIVKKKCKITNWKQDGKYPQVVIDCKEKNHTKKIIHDLGSSLVLEKDKKIGGLVVISYYSKLGCISSLKSKAFNIIREVKPTTCNRIFQIKSNA